MKIEAATGDLSKQAVDAAVVNIFSGAKRPGGATGAVDRAIGGVITDLIGRGEVRGEKGEITVVHTVGKAYQGFEPARVIVAGLGKQSEFDLDAVRSVSANVARLLRTIGARTAATVVHGAGVGGIEPETAAEALAEGALLGHYLFDKYKSKKDRDDRGLETLRIVELDRSKSSAFQRGIERAETLSSAASLARDLVNEPANVMTPTKLAEAAQTAARGIAGLTCEILDRGYAEKQGMRAYLGVAQGSVEPPRIIVMRYRGDARRPKNNIWIVGKGITFDSGGLSLKPSDGMTQMKGDMAGGAAVISAITAIATLKPKMNVTALVLATENMPSGSAQRVGDVVRAMSGKYIEIANTDAEGRLTLADALTYAKQEGAQRIVDVATLTGAAVVALGHGNTAAFSNNDELVERVIAAGKQRGEPIWRLPLDSIAKKQNESKIADIKNTGGRAAGSITGAHFIGEFAGDTPWVHLDIAGTFLADSTTGWTPEGATGVMVRTLTQLALDLGARR
ncbi:MAG: leucyl aminopeptidase [Chloroflexi bacterium]|nr:leucyl aminopeptidase [Chloroflexota bacterium]